jgi:hypothetical protein
VLERSWRRHRISADTTIFIRPLRGSSWLSTRQSPRTLSSGRRSALIAGSFAATVCRAMLALHAVRCSSGRSPRFGERASWNPSSRTPHAGAVTWGELAEIWLVLSEPWELRLMPRKAKASSASSSVAPPRDKSQPAYWLFKEDLRFLLVFSGVLDTYSVGC